MGETSKENNEKEEQQRQQRDLPCQLLKHKDKLILKFCGIYVRRDKENNRNNKNSNTGWNCVREL